MELITCILIIYYIGFSQKGWPSPEIRGAVGLPWSSLSEQLQSSSVNCLYSPLDNNRVVPVLSSIDYNNVNQNILEHRSTSSGTTGGNVFRNSPKVGSQSASVPTSVQNSVRPILDVEKVKKHYTPAETGVLRSHANTPNGKIAWPNDRQLGWQPKNSEKLNINLSWCQNGNWPGDDYGQRNNNGLQSPVTSATSSGWQSQQQHSQQLPINFRQPDRGMLITAQPQMQRIVSISDV